MKPESSNTTETHGVLMMKKLALAALAGALAAMAWPSAANAETHAYRWEHRVVCVDDQTETMPVREVVEAIDPLVHVKLIYEPGCWGFAQTVEVTEEHRPEARWGGLTTLYPGTNNRIASAWIVFNLATIGHHDYDANRTLVAHEVMHVLGLDHTDASDSVMNYDTQYRYTGPTARDIAEANAIWVWRQHAEEAR